MWDVNEGDLPCFGGDISPSSGNYFVRDFIFDLESCCGEGDGATIIIEFA